MKGFATCRRPLSFNVATIFGIHVDVLNWPWTSFWRPWETSRSWPGSWAGPGTPECVGMHSRAGGSIVFTFLLIGLQCSKMGFNGTLLEPFGLPNGPKVVQRTLQKHIKKSMRFFFNIPENQPFLPVLDPKYWSILDLKSPHRAYIRSETAEKYQNFLARVCNTHMLILRNFEKKYFFLIVFIGCN